MSSFTAENVVALCILLLFPGIYLFFGRRPSTLYGFGAALAWKEKDGTLWVVSRLVDSPAGRAGINMGTRVVSINGVAMNFPSHLDLREWHHHYEPKQGVRETWVVEEENGTIRSITMEMEKFPSFIPGDWDPNKSEGRHDSGKVRMHPLYCAKIGEYRFRPRLTLGALMETYFWH